MHLQARVGVNPGEQQALQPILLDIWVGLEDLSYAAQSDKLRHTIDYVSLARTARKVVEQRHYALVETLATAIAQQILARPGAVWTTVRLRKLNCLSHASSAGVEVHLELHDTEVLPRPLDPQEVSDQESILIVGGGAAGLAASLWCRRLGHPALLLDPAPQLGGQLQLVHGLMTDIPALDPLNGQALARRLWRQFVQHQGRWLQARLQRVEQADGQWRIVLQGTQPAGQTWTKIMGAGAVILAMGVQRRRLAVPGEQELLGRGVLHTAAKEIEHLAGKPVVVVGGGDSACENALKLAEIGARVTLIHHRDQLSARREFVQQIAGASLSVLYGSRAHRFLGQQQLDGVEVETAGKVQVLPAHAALIRIGWVPCTDALPLAWLRPDGFINADSHGRLPQVQGIFAAGDLLGRLSPCVATAFGSGAEAARAAVHWIER